MITGIFNTPTLLNLWKFLCRLKIITFKMDFKKSGIFPFNRCAISESSFDHHALQRYKTLQIQNGELKELINFRWDIPTKDLDDEILTISHDFCIDIFPANKLIFTNDFHVNESIINDNLPIKKDNISPDFDNNLITRAIEKLSTNVDYSARTSFQIQHHKDSDTTFAVFCDLSVQINLTLDRNKSITSTKRYSLQPYWNIELKFLFSSFLYAWTF